MTRPRGFTLVELMITMAILGILFAAIAPNVIEATRRSRATTCIIYRQNIQVAAGIYINTHRLMPGDDLPTIPELVAENLLPGEDTCPSGGVYVWADPTYQGPSTPYLINCSVHFLAGMQ